MTVYFIRAGEDGPVKIGISKNVSSRFSALQNMHYQELKLIRTIEGGRPQERCLHTYFDRFRIRGEWFSFDKEMLEINLPENPSSAPPLSMQNIHETFVARVEWYLQCTGMSPTVFGQLAAGDMSFITYLKKGRRPTKDRIFCVLDWMQENSPVPPKPQKKQQAALKPAPAYGRAMEKDMNDALKRAVQAAGGGSALAKICSVTPSGVTQWKIAPAGRVLQIEAASGVSRHELRPDLYPPEIGGQQ